MAKKEPRVDAYIAKSQPFARPILKHLRSVVHQGCPDCEEAIKWGMPHFAYKGMFCGIAAFKQHAAFWLWKGKLIVDPKHSPSSKAMGNFGRITSLKELPPKATLVGYVKRARALKDAGVKSVRPARTPRKPLPVPADLKAALAKNAKARATFADFAPSHRREYIEWITGAKAADTRLRRLTTAIALMAAGKSQNWKYEKK
jgi:uncharacterized protein YdeI (YjbR/CyaY-like superfamily)